MKKDRAQIRIAKEQASCYRDFLSLVDAYLRIHPIPDSGRMVVEVVPCDIGAGRFDYYWPGIQRTDSQQVWQGVFDVWLKGRYKTAVASDGKGVKFRIMKESDNDEGAADNNDAANLITGEGLASFHAVDPKYSMDDLIVSDDVSGQLEDVIAILAHQDLIYETWGFETVDKNRRSVVNFYGPPGTGKTMAAHCIAERLGRKIIIANFAEIESKYVGDSPKNLENIFHTAKEKNAVLFFDEADSFLGKRLTSISSSSDQAVNSLRSKLLQLLEDHVGVVVFCTNLLRNYDKAFESWLLFSVKFDLPDADCRRRLILQKIPKKLPLASPLNQDGVNRLVEITEGFSGREIKNAVLKVLCRGAVSSKKTFEISDFVDGFLAEKQEVEKMHQECGRISKAKSEAIGEKVREKLATGDYAIQKGEEGRSDV